MVPSLPLLPCESSVSVKENPDRKKQNKTTKKERFKTFECLWGSGNDAESTVYFSSAVLY